MTEAVLWECGGCGCRYAAGAPRCPDCPETAHREVAAITEPEPKPEPEATAALSLVQAGYDPADVAEAVGMTPPPVVPEPGG